MNEANRRHDEDFGLPKLSRNVEERRLQKKPIAPTKASFLEKDYDDEIFLICFRYLQPLLSFLW